MTRLPSLVAFVLAVVLLADLIASNFHWATVILWPLPDALELPQGILLAAVAALAFLCGRISLWPKHLVLKRSHRRQARKLAALEAEKPTASPV